MHTHLTNTTQTHSGPASYGDIKYVPNSAACSMGGQSVPLSHVDVLCRRAAQTPAPGETLRVVEEER